jgi:hypothetical protein
MRPLTAAELAAFLGITESGVRQAVRRHRVPSRGKRGKAKLYNPADVLRHTGAHDRRAGGDPTHAVSQ